jgi:hypothetical protein
VPDPSIYLFYQLYVPNAGKNIESHSLEKKINKKKFEMPRENADNAYPLMRIQESRCKPFKREFAF